MTGSWVPFADVEDLVHLLDLGLHLGGGGGLDVVDQFAHLEHLDVDAEGLGRGDAGRVEVHVQHALVGVAHVADDGRRDRWARALRYAAPLQDLALDPGTVGLAENQVGRRLPQPLQHRAHRFRDLARRADVQRHPGHVFVIVEIQLPGRGHQHDRHVEVHQPGRPASRGDVGVRVDEQQIDAAAFEQAPGLVRELDAVHQVRHDHLNAALPDDVGETLGAGDDTRAARKLRPVLRGGRHAEIPTLPRFPGWVMSSCFPPSSSRSQAWPRGMIPKYPFRVLGPRPLSV